MVMITSVLVTGRLQHPVLWLWSHLLCSLERARLSSYHQVVAIACTASFCLITWEFGILVKLLSTCKLIFSKMFVQIINIATYNISQETACVQSSFDKVKDSL